MPKRRWTPDIIIASIKTLPPTGMYSAYVKSTDEPLWKAAVRYFGSWNEALEAAELPAHSIMRRKSREAPNKGQGGECKEDSCIRKHHAKGMCQIHYNQAKRRGEL